MTVISSSPSSLLYAQGRVKNKTHIKYTITQKHERQTHTQDKKCPSLGMDRPLKAVPDKLFHNIHWQYDKVVCTQFIQITHSAYSITTAQCKCS